MIFVRGLVGIVRHVLEVHFLGDSKQACDAFVGLTLVLLDRRHVVGVPFDNRLGDLGLAAQGIDGHNAARKFQHAQQFGERRDLVRLVTLPRFAS
jgi:hypothetical protein